MTEQNITELPALTLPPPEPQVQPELKPEVKAESAPEPQPGPKPQKPHKDRPRASREETAGTGGVPVLLWLLTLLALIGVLTLGWFAWQTNASLQAARQELARRIADSETAQHEAQANAKQNREGLDALQAKVGAVDARMAEMQSQQVALDAMYQELSGVREDRLLAEIEQDVAIAAQQLQLAGNVEAALIALQGAEARLAKSPQAQFLSLRKLISRDIERLKSLPGADISGIALKLEAVLNAVPNLPLAFEQRPAKSKPEQPALADAAPAFDWRSSADWQALARAWFTDVWHELRQLVSIERIDRPDPGLLLPREVFFLRENLRLRLLSARLALLSRDSVSFKSDVTQAQTWIEQYFDGQAPAVQDARKALQALGKLDVTRTEANLNETLAALRNFKLVRDRGDRGHAR